MKDNNRIDLSVSIILFTWKYQEIKLYAYGVLTFVKLNADTVEWQQVKPTEAGTKKNDIRFKSNTAKLTHYTN